MSKLSRFSLIVYNDFENLKDDMLFIKALTEKGIIVTDKECYNLYDKDNIIESTKKIILITNENNNNNNNDDDNCDNNDVISSLSVLDALQLSYDINDNNNKIFIVLTNNNLLYILNNVMYLCDYVYVNKNSKLQNSNDFSHIIKNKSIKRSEIPYYIGCNETYKRKKYVADFSKNYHQEYNYINLLQKILETGLSRKDRTGVGTLSIFSTTMEFSLTDSIPILTTKKIFWKKVIGELLWFISGSTKISDLHKDNIHFWDANGSRSFLDQRGLTTYEEGDLGPVSIYTY